MQKNLLLSVAAGAVLFVWGFISWALLPWHNLVASKFTDEAAVSQVLKANAPVPGVYYLPFSEKDHGPNQPGAFANVLHSTEMNMGVSMGTGLITQILSAFLVLLLVSQTAGLGYLGKAGFIALTGFTIAFVSHAPYWNWFGFPAAYVGVTILDMTIGWALAGLAVGRFVSTRS